MTKRKAHILDVAEGLFAMHGYDGTTTRLISDTANANIAMISYYFGGKEKLLKAILDRFADDLYLLVNRIQEKEHDPQERLRSWVTTYIDYVFDRPNPIIVAHRQLSLITNKPEIFSSTRKAFDKVYEQIHRTLTEGKKAGVFRDIDVELTIITLKSSIEDLVLESNLIKEDFNITVSEQDKLYPDDFRKRVKKHMLLLLGVYVFSSN
ncbi:MAG: TetR/AcrR family transcriptional regulator [Balneolales bacterium]